MSNATQISVTASGNVATDFTTDDGKTTSPVNNVLIVSADDTIQNNDSGVRTIGNDDGMSGRPAANEIRVEITNRLQGIATVEFDVATTGDIITFGLGATAAVYRIEFDVVGIETTSGLGVGYSVDATARTNGTVATIIQTPNKDADEDQDLPGMVNSLAAADVNVIADSNNIILRATGVTLRTISYSAVGIYVRVLTP